MAKTFTGVPYSEAFGAKLGVREHPGWIGPFTTRQAMGAIRNGTPIEKALYERGDANPIGTKGVVLGSIDAGGGVIGYFVEWEPHPKVAVFVVDKKIRRA